eukprot:jgi/Chlat1/6901/Chrsp52S06631
MGCSSSRPRASRSHSRHHNQPSNPGTPYTPNGGGEEQPSTPLSPTADDNAVAYFLYGNTLLEKGAYHAAIEAYTEAVRLNAYHERGLAYNEKGDRERALEDYSLAIELDPEYSAAFVSRAALYNRQGNYELAIKDCDAAIKLNPLFPDPWNHRGLANKYSGNVEKAIEDWEEAARLEPRLLCCVCMDGQRGTRLHPCLHSALCGPCAKHLVQVNQPCPVCSTAISHVEFGTFGKTYAMDAFLPEVSEWRGKRDAERSMRAAAGGADGATNGEGTILEGKVYEHAAPAGVAQA